MRWAEDHGGADGCGDTVAAIGYRLGVGCSLQFIGNATMLVRLGPFTVLTDPNFLHRGQRAYLGLGLTSKRLHDPALRIDELPPLDLIVLSHMHGDHWDRVAKKGLARDVPIVTTAKAARALHRQRFTAAEGLATWENRTLTDGAHSLVVTAVPGRHATGIADRLLPPVMGSVLDYVVDDLLRLRLYITGDTLYVDDLRPIPERFPGIHGAVLHLGGTTLPGGRMVTMDGRQGAELLELVQPQYAVPVHVDDYTVFASPLEDFLSAAQGRGLDGLIRVVPRGGTLDLLTAVTTD